MGSFLCTYEMHSLDLPQAFLQHGFQTVLVGDMNAEPDSPEMQLIASRMENLTEGIGITYHGFMGPNQCSIDYIFLKGAISGTGVKKWDDCREGVFLSDHFPVSAELTLL